MKTFLLALTPLACFGSGPDAPAPGAGEFFDPEEEPASTSASLDAATPSVGGAASSTSVAGIVLTSEGAPAPQSVQVELVAVSSGTSAPVLDRTEPGSGLYLLSRIDLGESVEVVKVVPTQATLAKHVEVVLIPTPANTRQGKAPPMVLLDEGSANTPLDAHEGAERIAIAAENYELRRQAGTIRPDQIREQLGADTRSVLQRIPNLGLRGAEVETILRDAERRIGTAIGRDGIKPSSIRTDELTGDAEFTAFLEDPAGTWRRRFETDLRARDSVPDYAPRLAEILGDPTILHELRNTIVEEAARRLQEIKARGDGTLRVTLPSTPGASLDRLEVIPVDAALQARLEEWVGTDPQRLELLLEVHALRPIATDALRPQGGEVIDMRRLVETDPRRNRRR